jgi:hypothetical protein
MVKNPTHGSFADILVAAKPELRLICETIRSLIASLHKDVVEVVWPRQKIASFGVGPKKMTEHYAYFAVQSDHVNLGFYHGASLSDPARLLEGTGKKLRHVKLHSLSASKSPAITALLRQAIAERKRYVADS